MGHLELLKTVAILKKNKKKTYFSPYLYRWIFGLMDFECVFHHEGLRDVQCHAWGGVMQLGGLLEKGETVSV